MSLLKKLDYTVKFRKFQKDLYAYKDTYDKDFKETISNFNDYIQKECDKQSIELNALKIAVSHIRREKIFNNIQLDSFLYDTLGNARYLLVDKYKNKQEIKAICCVLYMRNRLLNVRTLIVCPDTQYEQEIRDCILSITGEMLYKLDSNFLFNTQYSCVTTTGDLISILQYDLLGNINSKEFKKVSFIFVEYESLYSDNQDLKLYWEIKPMNKQLNDIITPYMNGLSNLNVIKNAKEPDIFKRYNVVVDTDSAEVMYNALFYKECIDSCNGQRKIISLKNTNAKPDYVRMIKTLVNEPVYFEIPNIRVSPLSLIETFTSGTYMVHHESKEPYFTCTNTDILQKFSNLPNIQVIPKPETLYSTLCSILSNFKKDKLIILHNNDFSVSEFMPYLRGYGLTVGNLGDTTKDVLTSNICCSQELNELINKLNTSKQTYHILYTTIPTHLDILLDKANATILLRNDDVYIRTLFDTAITTYNKNTNYDDYLINLNNANPKMRNNLLTSLFLLLLVQEEEEYKLSCIKLQILNALLNTNCEQNMQIRKIVNAEFPNIQPDFEHLMTQIFLKNILFYYKSIDKYICDIEPDKIYNKILNYITNELILLIAHNYNNTNRKVISQ